MILLDKVFPDGRTSAIPIIVTTLCEGMMGQERISGHVFVRFVRLYYLLLVLLFLSPTLGLGQRLILTPSLSVGERYDDNIFQEQDATDDFITVITPGIDVLYTPTALTTLDFRYHPSFELFADHSSENQVAHRLSLLARSPLTRLLSLSVRDRLVITDEPGDRDRNRPLSPGEVGEEVENPPVDGIDDVPPDGTRDESREGRQRTIRNFAEALLAVQLTTRTSIGLRFESLIEDVEDEDEVDEFRYGGGARLRYITSASRGNSVNVGYDVEFFMFRRNAETRVEPEDFRVQTVSGGYQHNFSSTLVGDIALGYAFTDSDDPDIDGNAGFIGNIGIIKKLRTGQAELRYYREFTSGRGEGDQVVADRFLANFVSRISPKVTARLRGNVSLLDFQERNDEDRLYFAVAPSLAYEALRFWRLSLAYTFEFSNFDDADEPDRTNHRLTFISQFILRRGLSLDLTYRFRARRFDGTSPGGSDEFDRNEIMLSITYAPPLRFF